MHGLITHYPIAQAHTASFFRTKVPPASRQGAGALTQLRMATAWLLTSCHVASPISTPYMFAGRAAGKPCGQCNGMAGAVWTVHS